MSVLDSENLEPTLSIEDGKLLAQVADWGPAEDWADWVDAVGDD